MSLNTAQEQAWDALKYAVDNYYKATSAEVAVVTPSSIFSPSTNHNYQSIHPNNQKIIIYGHGNLVNQIKGGLDHSKNVDEVILLQKGDKSIDNASARIGTQIPMQRRNYDDQPMAKSLSTSFRTLKLDLHPTINTGTSGSTVTSTIPSDSIPEQMHKSKGKKSSKKSKKSFGLDQELELDDNLMFNESNEDTSESDSSDDGTQESEDSFTGNLPDRGMFKPNIHDPNLMSNAQFATSLPMNINLNWGFPPESSKLRSNRPADVKTPSVTIAKKFNKTDQTPQLNTMMASMQALARSVTDDSAMIFGDRPRPRLEASKHGF